MNILKDKTIIGGLSLMIFILSLISIPIFYLEGNKNLLTMGVFGVFIQGFMLGMAFLISGLFVYGIFIHKGEKEV